MKILLKQNYKSLNDFESDELTTFTVITGKNGSGKSQLIELFKHKSESGTYYDFIISNDYEISPNKIMLEGIANSDLRAQENNIWKSKINFNYKVSYNHSKERIDFLILLTKNNIWLEEVCDKSILKKADLTEEYLTELLTNLMINDNYFSLDGIADKNHKSKNFIENPRNFDELILAFKTGFSVNQHEKNSYEVSKIVAEYRNKSIDELSDYDYLKTPINEYYLDIPNLFKTQIESLFYNYSKRREINNNNYLNKKEYGDNNNSISDNDFINKHRQPWKIVNDIFNKHKLDFEFQGIEREGFSSDATVNYQLIKKIRKSIHSTRAFIFWRKNNYWINN